MIARRWHGLAGNPANGPPSQSAPMRRPERGRGNLMTATSGFQRLIRPRASSDLPGILDISAGPSFEKNWNREIKGRAAGIIHIEARSRPAGRRARMTARAPTGPSSSRTLIMTSQSQLEANQRSACASGRDRRSGWDGGHRGKNKKWCRTKPILIFHSSMCFMNLCLKSLAPPGTNEANRRRAREARPGVAPDAHSPERLARLVGVGRVGPHRFAPEGRSARLSTGPR